MKISNQQLVIAEMKLNQQPRTPAEISASIKANTGFDIASSAISVVLNTLKNHRDYDLQVIGQPGSKKYRFKPALGEITQKIEKRLWEIRAQQGQS